MAHVYGPALRHEIIGRTTVRHIILASHHRFAEGLADTMAYIGNLEGLTVICAYIDETPISKQIAEVFADIDPKDEVIVLADIMQGSVNQAFAPYINDHVFLIAGTNVALALELAFADEPLTETTIETAIDIARQSMVLMNTAVADIDKDDE